MFLPTAYSLFPSPTAYFAMPYDPQEIERRWQQRWKEEQCFETPRADSTRKDCYVYAAPPFTTGRLHLGHVRSYTIADAYARFLRGQDAAVLFSIGFDSFGLPNEIAAVENQLPPREWVQRCMRDMKVQFERLGCGFDWSRAYDSSHQDLFQWSQWVFLKFLENDLVYKADGVERWCDHCQTVLAALQVNENRCWRCEQETRFVQISQWYLRLSAFAEELDESIEKLAGWDPTILKEQRALLGRVEGYELELKTENGDSLTAFTSELQTLPDASFVALSPHHPLLDSWQCQAQIGNDLAALRRSHWNRSERSISEMPVLDLRLRVGLPDTDDSLPVIVSPSVAQRFGVGTAVFGIPSRHRSDRMIAERLQYQTPWNQSNAARFAQRVIRYRCKDFSISRKRFWGGPIPIIHCPSCGTVPVHEQDLPVTLPEHIVPTGHGNPLEKMTEFKDCTCPECGIDAARETDTLDCHMDALWHIIPPCIVQAERKTNVFMHSELKRWLPATQIICGGDQAKYMLSYRFFFMALARCGLLQDLPYGTPAETLLMHGMVLADHKKMSKHLGNIVDPDELIRELGADALRWWVLDAANPRKDFNWTSEGIHRCRRFLDELWEFVTSRIDSIQPLDMTTDAVIDATHPLRAKLRKWHHTALTKTTTNYRRLQFNLVTRNLETLFQRLKAFEVRASEKPSGLDRLDKDAINVVLRTMLRLIEPLAPHLAEELWLRCGGQDSLSSVPWPKLNGNR